MPADAPLSDSDHDPREPSLRGEISHDRSTPAHSGPENITEPVTSPTSTGATAAHKTDIVVERRPVVAGYDVLGTLGHGGMGTVYEARDRSLGRTVALKMLRPGHRGLNPTELDRFRREARALARLDHVNVIPIYSEGECDGWPYFTMKLMAGGSLARQLAVYRDDPAAAALLVEKVARAVHYLHGLNVLHRDLKPANILLDDQGEPSVSDFGIAKLTDDAIELTVRGSVLGTRPYMAPEQAAGRNEEVGPAADIWALGVVLYELVAGRRPFVGDTDHAVTHAILNTDPPTPRSLRPGLSADLETIALKCLRKEPAQRYPTAEALADDLAHWRNKEPITARPESVLRQGRRAVRRHPAVAAAVILLAAAGVLAAAVAPYFDPDRPLREIDRRLARGEPVELIGELGPPTWHRWVPDLTGAVTADGPDQLFRLESHGPALLQLANDPPGGRYRFRAEIHHRQYRPVGGVGLYIGQRRTPAERPPDRVTYYAFDFADSDELGTMIPHRTTADGRRLTWAWWQFHVAPRPLPGVERHALTASFDRFEFPLASPDPSPWHHLALEVTPEAVRLLWDDEPPHELSWPALDDTARRHLRAVKQPDVGDYVLGRSAAGTLGLYCSSGVAEFRHVALEPLP